MPYCILCHQNVELVLEEMMNIMNVILFQELLDKFKILGLYDHFKYAASNILFIKYIEIMLHI